MFDVVLCYVEMLFSLRVTFRICFQITNSNYSRFARLGLGRLGHRRRGSGDRVRHVEVLDGRGKHARRIHLRRFRRYVRVRRAVEPHRGLDVINLGEVRGDL